MADPRVHAVTGVVPPQQAEARIRETWPSVQRFTSLATIGRILTRTTILAPLAWLLMALPFFAKLLPFLAIRYTITNRRVMIRRGWLGKPSQEVPLDKIDDVNLITDRNSDFFRAAKLDIVSDGKVALVLGGVPDADSFRHAILNARNAWVPDKAKTLPFIPAKT